MDATPLIPDFTLLRRIGGGGYGDVWLARSVTGVLRAIKIIDRSRFDDERPFFREFDGITRFQQAMGDQPRQLALLHVGRDERAGVLYYVMELADSAGGGETIDPASYVPLTLKEMRRRREQLPAADCVRIGTELAIALGELHQAGLLHRDVKPSNIIFVDGHAKLADIGLITSTDHTVSSIGTPEYAAPEGTGSVRADLYSLGRILYELATGLRPEDFPRLPADLPSRPDAAALVELNEIVLRACHSDPAQRYASADAVLSDLRLLQAGRSVQELNRTRRQLRRLSLAGAVLGAVAIVMIAVLGVRNYMAMRGLAAQETAFRKSAEASEQLARYTSDLHFAQLALSGRDIGGARTALRRQIPAPGEQDLRGLEWHALWNQSKGDAVRVIGAVGGPPITALALASDGKAAIAIERAEPNRAVRLDLETGARAVLADDCYGLAAFDPGKARLAVTARDHSLHVLNVTTGERVSQDARGILLECSPDGRTLLLAPTESDGAMLFGWDVETASQSFAWANDDLFPDGLLSRAAALHDGRRIAASIYHGAPQTGSYALVIWDRVAGTARVRIPDLPWVGQIGCSPAGRWLALATASDVRLVAIDNPQDVHVLEAGSGVNTLAFSPDGTQLAVGREDGVVAAWSVGGGAAVAVLEGHEAAVLSLRWTNDGRKLVTGGMDGTCRVWEPRSIRARNLVTGLWAGDLGSVVLDSAGHTLAVTGGDGAVVLMDTTSLQPLRTIPDAAHPLAFVEADTTLLSLSRDNALMRSRVNDGSSEAAGLRAAGDAIVTAFAVSGNKDFATIGTAAGEVSVWQLRPATDLGIRIRLPAAVRALAISDDGALLAASDWQTHLMVSSPNGIATLPTGNAIVSSLCVSADGERLVAGTELGRLTVWNIATGQVLARLQAHSGPVNTAVFSRDGARLLSGGGDGLVIVWMSETWRWLAAWSIESEGPISQHAIYRLEMDGAGGWLAAMTSNGVLQRWDCRAEPSPHVQ